MNKFLRVPTLIVLLMGVAACSGIAPYLHEPYTINRERVDFPAGPQIEEGTSATVCYAKSKATPAQIRAVAAEYCAKAGLGVRFVEQTYDVCPLLAPTAAVFYCQSTIAERRPVPVTGASPMQPGGAPAMPAFEAPKPAGAGRGFGTLGAADVSTTAKSQPFPTYLFNKGSSQP